MKLYLLNRRIYWYNENMRKIFKILGVFFSLVILLIVAFLGYSFYKIKTTDYIKYQGEWYTQEEFDDIISQNQAKIEEKNTPEEVYKNFYQAVNQGSADEAIEYITEPERIRYYKILSRRIDSLQQTLPEPEKIKPNQNLIHENSASYYYRNRDGSAVETISFKKGLDGYWRIDYF